MKKILMLHGVNLNRLGQRDPEHYGSLTLAMLEQRVRDYAASYQIDIVCYQSNHEGDLVDHIQQQSDQCAGIIINPGAFSHYSYALHDALLDSRLPTIEVHLSNLVAREAWRHTSVVAPACLATISGQQLAGYWQAVDQLMAYWAQGAKQ